MARMFPQDGPRGGRNARPDNDAEVAIYDAVQRRLGVGAGDDTDEYIIFQGVKWFSTTPNGAHQPFREMDFLIVSRRRGLLILEAKAAKIALSTERKNKSAANLNVVHDAYFDQARTLEDELTHFLLSAPLTCQHMASYRIGSAVWFPFSQPWPHDEKTTRGVPNKLILDSADLVNPEAGILRAFDYLGQRSADIPLSDAAIDALIATLDQTTLTMQARLSVRVPEAEELIQRLTDEQYDILEALSELRWLQIPGAAGTGKTVLAYEKAFRLAREGKRVLLLCSNPALAAWLTEMRDQDGRPETALFDIFDLKALCALAPRQRIVSSPEEDDEAPDASRAAQVISDLAKSWRQQQQKVQKRLLYDAVLIDEAQDFDQPLWRPLRQLLQNEKTGLFYVFYDVAQRERDGAWEPDLPGRVRYLPLVVNLRNTKCIFELVQRFYPEREYKQMRWRGVIGTPPVYIDPREITSQPGEEPEETALLRALRSLIEVEGVAPQDVLIITCRPMKKTSRSQEASQWYARGVEYTLGKHTIRRGAATVKGKVALSTVRAARGVERLAVILCELDGLQMARATSRDKLLYSAISRAKHQLIILGSEAQLLGRTPEPELARSRS
jgi:hypothetical protein